MDAAVRVRPRLRHDGLFYEDRATFVATAVSFVEEGLRNGETVLVNTLSSPVTPALHARFGDDPRVVFPDVAGYATPVGTIDGYRKAIDRGLAGGVSRCRAVGVLDLDATHLPWQEWLRYEAAVNRFFADLPVRTLCGFDAGRLPRGVTEAISRAHPGLLTAVGVRRNRAYLQPEELLALDGLAAPPLPVESTRPRLVLCPDPDLMDLRLEVYASVLVTDLPPSTVDDFVSAVGEVVANAHRHGAPPWLLRLWASPDAVVCTVTDGGPGIGDPLLGFDRPRQPSQGLGLWAARQLCDLLDYRRDAHGFTVRLASFR